MRKKKKKTNILTYEKRKGKQTPYTTHEKTITFTKHTIINPYQVTIDSNPLLNSLL